MSESENGQTTVDRLGSAAPEAIPSGTVDETAPQTPPSTESGATGAGAVLSTLEVLGVAERVSDSSRRTERIAQVARAWLPSQEPIRTLRDMLDSLDEEMDKLRELRGRIWDALGRKP